MPLIAPEDDSAASIEIVARFALPRRERRESSNVGAGSAIVERLVTLGWNAACPILDRVLGLPSIDAMHRRACDEARRGAPSGFEACLRAARARAVCDESELGLLPEAGATLVVSNHPLGGLDALALGSLVARRRPDVLIVANRMLERVEPLREHLLGVDVFGDAESANAGAMRNVVRALRAGRCVLVFPAGEVSHRARGGGAITDGPWSSHVARIAMRTVATVVAAHVRGRNSAIFQRAGLVHPLLRSALLPRELLRAQGSTIHVSFDHPMPPAQVARFSSAEGLVSYLRCRSYLLGDDCARDAARTATAPANWARVDEEPRASPETYENELGALGAEDELLRSGPFRVLVAESERLPHLMLEIARLRERSFRAVGEGTGRALDLDRFDANYRQLLVWDDSERRLVGGYRLARTDRVIARDGLNGLYTHTLFRFDPRLFEEIGPAFELGRSWVRAEYQRHPHALMLLWKGIGRLVVREPAVRHLLGPVSISNEFDSMSRDLLVRFLEVNRLLPMLARLVRARSPVRHRGANHWDPAEVVAGIADPRDLDELVERIETGRRSMPVLLRQYLKLDARLLATNVDDEFGECVDGLMLVDLDSVDRRVLRHYMGAEGLASWSAAREARGRDGASGGARSADPEIVADLS